MYEYSGVVQNYPIEKCEEKFLHLFGYQVIGPDGSNRFSILNQQNCEVGYIQYKKFQKSNAKGIPSIYGYVMEIDSKEIKCKRSRKETQKEDNYTFYIKRNGYEEAAELYLGENPCITIWSKEYGYINFRIGASQLFCNYKWKTKEHNFEDTIVVELGKRQQKCDYCLSFCDKEKDLENNKEITTLDLSIEEYPDTNSFLLIKQTDWENGKLILEEESKVAATFVGMFNKFKFITNSFQRFRSILNQILPFQNDAVESFLQTIEELDNLQEEIALFVPDIQKEQLKRNITKK